MADLKITLKLKHAKKTCEESFTALKASDEDSAEISALSLDWVAKGRYVLSLVVEYIYNFFIEGDSSYKDLDAKSEVMLLLESSRKLCMEVSSSTPQQVSSSTPWLYLLNQLVRRYGLDCVRTLGEYEELAWILPPEAIQQVNNEWWMNGFPWNVLKLNHNRKIVCICRKCETGKEKSGC